MEKKKVKLVNKGKLTGTGTVVEYMLSKTGWNELPEDKKYGLVDADFMKYNMSEVEFPHCIEADGKPVKNPMFPDEFEPI